MKDAFPKGKTTLILGGCRSGKSAHALKLAEREPGDRRVFVATCIPQDEEMRERVARHRKERGASWRVVEAPIAIADALDENGPFATVVLIDCLTLWMGNLFMAELDEAAVKERIGELTAALCRCPCPVVVVSNEIGMGIVPDNALSRRYRDAVGWANQAVAAAAQRVILTVAGLPLTLK